VDWARDSGSAATIEKASNSNNGIITASASATGQVVFRARVRSSSNTYITHKITVYVVSVSSAINVTATPVAMGSDTTASVTVGALPSGTGSIPSYTWVSSGNYLTRTAPATETTTATFRAASTGTSTVTFTALWSSSYFLGKVERKVNIVVQAIAVAPTGVTIAGNPSNAITASGSAYVAAVTLDSASRATLQLTAAVEPATASQSVTWSVSNSAIASLSATTGNSVTVTFTDTGSVDVIATAAGTAVSNIVTVTVNQYVPPAPVVTGVTINATFDTVPAGDARAISVAVSVSPNDDTTLDRGVTWDFTPESVGLVTFDSKDDFIAQVRFIGPGVVTITATSKADGSKIAQKIITIV
jgi:hypothetical protein